MPDAPPIAPAAETPAPTVRYRCTLLRAAEFRLDAGSMFGLVPRVVWSKTVPTDERGRISVQHNCLLLERLDEPPPGAASAPRLVLLETGTGDKLDEKSRDLFALPTRSILDALHETDASPGDIGAVIVSHLHFDHAGGLTRAPRPGEAPDWTGPASSFGAPRGDLPVKRSFPEARVIVQRREWQDALDNRSVMTRTYFADHLAPLADRVSLIDSPRPFAPGVVPGRHDRPDVPWPLRTTQVLPGIFVFLVPGHTWGQQATAFTDERGRTVVFTPDVLPTAWHVGAAYSLAYDVEPYTSMLSRSWLLHEAAQRGWVLMLDHEAGHPFFTVRQARGWYELDPA